MHLTTYQYPTSPLNLHSIIPTFQQRHRSQNPQPRLPTELKLPASNRPHHPSSSQTLHYHTGVRRSEADPRRDSAATARRIAKAPVSRGVLRIRRSAPARRLVTTFPLISSDARGCIMRPRALFVPSICERLRAKPAAELFCACAAAVATSELNVFN